MEYGGSIHYEKVKRDQYDRCNICGKNLKLTWDHVPPKCCNNRYTIKTNTWMEGLPTENEYQKQYQGGIKFRSLCEECNNNILGSNYDRILAGFTDDVIRMTTSSIVIPAAFNQPVKINRLCKAICGHLLAAKNFYDDESLIDVELRNYVLDMKRLPPERMSLLYWFYPYTIIALLRDITVKSYGAYAFPTGIISIMNSFPIAYILSTEKKENCGLVDLFKYCSNDIDEVVNIPIDCSSCYFPNTHNLRSPFWPCNVSDKKDGASFVLGSDIIFKDSKLAKQSIEKMKYIRNGK